MPTETDTVSNVSQAVSCDRQASRSLNPRRGRLAALRSWRSEMRRRITNWINDDPWMMGVFEPILLLLFIAMVGAFLRLL